MCQEENQGAQQAVEGAGLVGLGSLVGMLELHCDHLKECAQQMVKLQLLLKIEKVLDSDVWELMDENLIEQLLSSSLQGFVA